MKSIYVFFISTQFKTGKAIRFLTRGQYNHVAMSFQPGTRHLYAYSRYRYHEPLLSGFGVEYTDRYARDGDSVTIKVCEYKISDEHCRRIHLKINDYKAHQKQTRYNFLDILTYPFGKHVDIRFTHTCISFLLDLLEIDNIHTINKLEKKLSGTEIYEGPLTGLQSKYTRSPVDFYERRGRMQVCSESAVALCQLAGRFATGCVRKIIA